MQQQDDHPQLRTEQGEKFPYPACTYPARLIWTMVWLTIWQLANKRIPALRSLILKLFGARITLRSNIAGSTRIEMPWLLEMDQWVTLGPRVHVYNLGGVKIGHHTAISQDVYLCGGTHDYT